MHAKLRSFVRERAPFLRTVWRSVKATGFPDAWNALPARVRLYDGKTWPITRKIQREIQWWRTFEFDLEAQAVFARYAGGDFIDVGAATGAYSLVLAPKACPGDRFVALEPDSRVFPDLLRTLASLSIPFPDVRFAALQVAAGDGTPVRMEHPLGPDQHPRFISTELDGGFPAVTVDSVASALGLRPTFIKVDVEGAELGVLRGMREVLRKHHPTLLLETHPGMLPNGVTMEMITDELHAEDYNCEYEIDGRHHFWVPRNAVA